MREAFVEFVQAIVTVVAGVMIYVIFKIVDVCFRVMDWWTRRDTNLDKPPDLP